MHLNINTRVPIARQCESDFVIQMLVDVMVPGEFNEVTLSKDDDHEELEPEFVVGRMWAERLDWFAAERCGYSVAAICDQASGTWMQILETLCHRGGESFRKDLGIDSFVSEIVFLHEILLHPEIRDRTSIVDAALRGLSTDNSLLLMYHEQSQAYHLEDWECRDLGFKKIARSNLLLRDNHLRYPFGDHYGAGRRVDFTASAEHEIWLLERWEDLITDHPSL